MTGTDTLRQLLIDFFQLPAETPTAQLSHFSIGKWDSLAMVQLITELQTTFQVQFDIEEIERLRSYDEIRAALAQKGRLASPD